MKLLHSQKLEKKYLLLGREDSYCLKEHSNSNRKYTKEDIKLMLEFFIDNTLMVFAKKGLQTDRCHTKGHELCPLLADIFLYLYEQNRESTEGYSKSIVR